MSVDALPTGLIAHNHMPADQETMTLDENEDSAVCRGFALES
jgi:hypothetical protein